MRTLRTVAELRAELAGPRRAGHTIALVPTMGAFHAGHLSLMRRAREGCDAVVVSLFVNPEQFEDARDLSAYPREESRDARLAEEVGVDYLFAPAADEVYPPGFATAVTVSALTEGLEGAHRGPEHFRGVTTVVTKLLNMVSPDVAYFGQKDAQQAIVIQRLVRDLDMPVRIEICPTVREPDGLAMSSRNAHLGVHERERAVGLNRALAAVQSAVAAGERDAAAAIDHGRRALSAYELEPEYLELVSADTLSPVTTIDGEALAVIAARVGSTRLVDNQIIRADRASNGSLNTNGRP